MDFAWLRYPMSSNPNLCGGDRSEFELLLLQFVRMLVGQQFLEISLTVIVKKDIRSALHQRFD